MAERHNTEDPAALELYSAALRVRGDIRNKLRDTQNRLALARDIERRARHAGRLSALRWIYQAVCERIIKDGKELGLRVRGPDFRDPPEVR